MIEDDQRKQNFQYYVTACLGRISATESADHGVKWEIPSFYEMCNPSESKPSEEKSGAEILDDLLSALGD